MCSSQDVSIVAGDVRDEAHVKRLFEVTAEKYGALHRSRLTGSANKVDNALLGRLDLLFNVRKPGNATR